MHITICDVPVDAISKSEALERCRGLLHDAKQHHITAVNPEIVVEAQKNPVFMEVLQKSDLALADGFGIVLAARYLHGVRLECIPGVDFMVALCGLAAEEGVSVFFLGGRESVARKTAEILKSRFPSLRVSGWSEDLDISKFQNIDMAILFVALGAPKQELWIAQYLKELPQVKIAMGVGGAFDLISGKIKRAPRMMRKLGLEWLWRLAMEPRRLARVCRAIVVFPILILKEKARVYIPL